MSGSFAFLILVFTFHYAISQEIAIDHTFNTDVQLNSGVEVIKLQGDGKILIGGFFHGNLKRLNQDGTTDHTFKTPPINGTVFDIEILEDNKILVGGSFGKLLRLNENGSLDTTFKVTVEFGFIKNIDVLDGGKIIIAGTFTRLNGGQYINAIARLNADGSLDMSFNLNLGKDSGIRDFGIQSDGKIIIAGELKENNQYSSEFRRYNIDNTIDTTFNSDNSVKNTGIHYIGILPDDKIMISGGFVFFYNSTSIKGIARLNANGTIDTTFNSYSFTSYAIYNVRPLSTGKYLINGSFNEYHNVPSGKIARINHDGSIDSSFNIGAGADDIIMAIDIQQDGKVLIGGSFTSFNTVNRHKIARLQTHALNIQEPSNQPDILIFPNPVKNYFTIKLMDSNIKIKSVSILAIDGRLLKTYDNYGNFEQITLNDLKAGIYFVKVETDKGIITKTIIK